LILSLLHTVLRNSCYLLLCIFAISSFSIAATFNSEKNIIVVNKEEREPLWKQRWDQARELSDQQRYPEAVTKYLSVLEEKPLIEAVKWELCSTYISLKDYDQALVLLESLLESSPDKIEYLISGGQMALLRGNAEQAGRYFGQALELDPGGQLSEQALLGMINALKVQNKKQLTIPLMEQLYQRGVAGREVLIDLARLNRDYQNLEHASYYYLELVKKYRVEPELVKEAAETLEVSGKIEDAAAQWNSYLESNPNYLPYQKKLADYYLEKGETVQGLPHMLDLVENGIDRQKYILEIAQTYLHKLGRTDRALYYFELYKEEFPEGADVSFDIENLRLILANNLLAIVENDGVWMLWRDLARVTPDRIGIYRTMAEMLEGMGRPKEKELLEVLRIILVHDPEDFEIVTKISEILLKRRLFEDCSAHLAQAYELHRNEPNYFLLQAQCQAGEKRDLDELKSYVSYLELLPREEAIRIKALNLAGNIGLVDQMHDLYFKGKKDVKTIAEIPVERSLAYFDGLLKNGQSRIVEELRLGLPKTYTGITLLGKLYGNLAATFFNQNRYYKAEEILRIFGTNYPDSIESFLLFIEYSLQTENKELTAQWLSALKEKIVSTKPELSKSHKSRIFINELRFDELSDKKDVYQRAIDYLNLRIKGNQIIAEDVEILLFIARNYFLTERYELCQHIIKRFRQKFKGNDELSSLLYVATEEINNGADPVASKWNHSLSYSEQLSLYQELLRLNRTNQSILGLTELAALLPSSARTQLMLAEAHMKLFNYAIAHQSYEWLHSQVPAESYFREQLYRIEAMQGNYSEIFKVFSVLKDEAADEDGISARQALNYSEAKLLWARSLWADDQWDESLEIYELVADELNKQMNQLVSQLYTIDNKSMLEPHTSSGSSDLTAENEEMLDRIMSDSYVSENLSSDIAQISAHSYDNYRWYKITDREIAAKSALKAKKFYQAEINYKELVKEEEVVTETIYPDLATIYSRLGRFQEETEVLEKIKEANISYPEIEVAAEKNLRQQQPHLSLVGGYSEEEGRSGFKDITRKYGGIEVQIKPTLHQYLGIVSGRYEYGNSIASTLAKSNYLLGSYTVQFGDTFEGDVNIGFEDFDTDGTTFQLYDFSLKTTLEERVEIFAKLKQDPVDDTIQSLAEGIYRRDFQGGLSLDYLFGMFFGFDVSFLDYNDGNEGEQYYLWSSYRWFGNRSSLDFTYSYLNLSYAETDETRFGGSDDDQDNGLSYWSPGNYWKHNLVALYKLELWPTGRLQSGTSSLTASYGLGFETGDLFVHEFNFDILLEISQSFLVKGTFSTVLSDDYDNQEVYASLVYRW